MSLLDAARRPGGPRHHRHRRSTVRMPIKVGHDQIAPFPVAIAVSPDHRQPV